MAEEGATSHFDNASYIQKLEDVLTQVVNECVDEQPAQPFEFIADRLRNQDAGGADDSSGQRLPHPSGASLDLSAETLRADEWSLLSWCEAAGVHRVLFSALRRAVVAQNGGRYSSEAALAFVQGLQSREAVAAVLSSAPILDTLVDLMWEGAQKLRAAPAATGSQLNDKFSADGSGFTLKYGDLSTFFGGLEGKIGAPNPKIFEAMEQEHTKAADSRELFTTGNYGVNTTPQIEWNFVVRPEETPEGGWPEETVLRGSDRAELMRTPLPAEVLESRREEINVQLRKLSEPEMMREEVIAGRLYTGPLFVKYNDLLRGFGGALAGCKGNKYVTTSHAINSCIVKASKLTKATTVYRGVNGGMLPEAFWKPNAQGVKGGIEAAFMSTTHDRGVAMHYAGGQAGKPALLVEMRMGMIDRGAELGWLSQYPHEKEVLFNPLTGLEVQSTHVEGAVLVVVAKPSVNLTSMTLEQVLGKRKKLLTDMSKEVLLELRRDVREGSHPGTACETSGMAPIEGVRYFDSHTGRSFCEASLTSGRRRRCVASEPLTADAATARLDLAERALHGKLLSEPAKWFNDDANYAAAAAVPLMVKRALMQPAEAPMLRLLGCKSAAELPEDVSPLEALQAIERAVESTSGPPTDKLSAKNLMVIDPDTAELRHWLGNIAEPKTVWLDNRARRAEIPQHIGALLPQLEIMDLSGCGALAALPDLFALHCLKELNLTDCWSLSVLPDLPVCRVSEATGSEDGLPGLLSLKRLILSGCSSLCALPDATGATATGATDATVAGNLRSLVVVGLPPQLMGWEEGGRKAYDLRTAAAMTKISFAGNGAIRALPQWLVDAIAESRLPALACLDLDGCAALKDLPRVSVLVTLENLKELKVKGCASLQKGGELSSLLNTLPLVRELSNEAMRDRHWSQLHAVCGKEISGAGKPSLAVLLSWRADQYADDIHAIVERAKNELWVEISLKNFEGVWKALQLEYTPFCETGVQILLPFERYPTAADLYEVLDGHEVTLQTMWANRFMGFFETHITEWKAKLAGMRAVLENWVQVRREWGSLQSIFGSEDIREQLPEDAKRFDGIDAIFREQMADASQAPNVLDACLKDGRNEAFVKCIAALELCNRSLSEYLETKRKKFPRFYFISQVDLVDTLTKGKHAPAVQEHFSKFTDNLGGIIWDTDLETGKEVGVCKGMFATDKERVTFPSEFECRGSVEEWLLELMAHCCGMLREQLESCLAGFIETPRDRWLNEWCAQLCTTTHQIWWTSEVNKAFERLKQGNDQSMKEYSAQQIANLNIYIQLVLGEMTKDMRTKVKSLITIEVHARDVALRLIADRTEASGDFVWQSQLKYRWDQKEKDCVINQCDAEFRYAFEFVGNPGRLTITALTERCRLTITQALHLHLGGAPLGPNGTGKTETIKDLCVVMDCSDQMNDKITGNIFKGLAQMGAWGCFDEFDRIPVEVLSVVASQFGCILDGIKAKADTIVFEQEKIALIRTTGAFITMDPGYAGRVDLPENLKALFRSCVMALPDFAAIAEIALCSEGFLQAKVLSTKLYRLFQLSEELLSKQRHYDWGLRAMNAILRIAGGAKRANPERTEPAIMMCALRDSNLTKFVPTDYGTFLCLVNDMFPKLDAALQTDARMAEAIKAVIKQEGKLLPVEVLSRGQLDLLKQVPDGREVVADGQGGWRIQGPPRVRRAANRQTREFVKKVGDLSDLLGIRHCVFVLGPAGSAKSAVWQTLQSAWTHLNLGGGPVQVMPLNPKAVSCDELYGCVNLATKQFNDGIMAKIMRDFSTQNDDVPKWIVLDGNIDAEWVESIHGLMDDNKVLTLVSNERIPLAPSMRLLFEIHDLANASPATASRAGVLFLNETDIGWQPYVLSWIDRLQKTHDGFGTTERARLDELVGTYVPPTLEIICKSKWSHLTPLTDLAMVSTLCAILEGLLDEKNCPPGSSKGVYEAYFQFAAIWAFGGAFGSDVRKEFSEWWRAEWAKTSFKFPDDGLVFDYFIENDKMYSVELDHYGNAHAKHWREVVTHEMDEGIVLTIDTTRLSFLIDLLTPSTRPIMLVGGAGSAKTSTLQTAIRRLSTRPMLFQCPLNYCVNASKLQQLLQRALEKKTGYMFAPPGANKSLVYLIDDMNLPASDKYGTQSAIELLRQHHEYGGWYNKSKPGQMSQIRGTQYMATMSPVAGRLADRMQRHFATFATAPNEEEGVLSTIYDSILDEHLSENGFNAECQQFGERIIACAVMLHEYVAEAFPPKAGNVMCQWSLHQLSRVIQGMCTSTAEYYTEPLQLVRLWLHESCRVYADRLADEQGVKDFEKLTRRVTQNLLGNLFSELDQEKLHARPLVFTRFAVEGRVASSPRPISDMGELSACLSSQLGKYNETNAAMNLVLFEDAMRHICRISRIIETPRGSALLIGHVGTGRHSLVRLAAFISGATMFQLGFRRAVAASRFELSSGGYVDIQADMRELMRQVGVLGSSTVLVLTDSQIVDEDMVANLNSLLLGSGDLVHPQKDAKTIFFDVDAVVSETRMRAKAAGRGESFEAVWDFFISRARENLHVVFCFSPVGEALKNRLRRFPALSSCVDVDWFHPWPEEALSSIAKCRLSDLDVPDNAINFMPYAFMEVSRASQKYWEQEGRFNYITPAVFLDALALYETKLASDRKGLQAQKERLQRRLDGLAAIEACNNVAKVETTQRDDLANQEVASGLASEGASGLASEGVRWANELASLDAKRQLLVGDALLTSVFVVYLGNFSRAFRQDLLQHSFLPYLKGEVTSAPGGVPMSDSGHPLKVLATDEQIAGWNAELLPAGQHAAENGAIVTSTVRWPLIIDPQLQGIRWIKKHEEACGLVVARFGEKELMNKLESALRNGKPVMIESIQESIVDAALNPLIGRQTTARGSKLVVKLGHKEVDYSPEFKLYLQTKLSNPHYQPEVQTQTTLVNFMVTEDGLEDQLLAIVAKLVLPDLAKKQEELVGIQQDYTSMLVHLESRLLDQLAEAEGDVMSNDTLVLAIEEFKEMSGEMSAKSEALSTARRAIDAEIEGYLPVARRGSLIFFLIRQLHNLSHVYQFSLDAYKDIFSHAVTLGRAALRNSGHHYVPVDPSDLIDELTHTIYSYVACGIYEEHRLQFSTQLAFRIAELDGTLPSDELELLLRPKLIMEAPKRPVSLQWLPGTCWVAVCSLAEQLPDAFGSLPAEMDGSTHWQAWFDHEHPEAQDLPGECARRLSGFQRLLIVRALRLDLMTRAIYVWVRSFMGERYLEHGEPSSSLMALIENAALTRQVFFLLAPGGASTVDGALQQISKTMKKELTSISLGQGQEPAVEKQLDRMHASGGWLMLKNIELVAGWLPKLERKLEALCADGAHPDFRVFLSALPQHFLPEQILQSSFKLTIEAPSGLKARMLGAYGSFTEAIWEGCSKQKELKAIIFGLCFFHASMIERRKFGPIGWSHEGKLKYDFNQVALQNSIAVARNQLGVHQPEAHQPEVPFEAMRYLVSEVIYGGHVSDDIDRRLLRAYADAYLREELLEGLAFFQKFEAPPPNLSHQQYLDYIGESLSPREAPMALGLHTNAEINFMTSQGTSLLKVAAELRLRSAAGGGGATTHDKVRSIIDDVSERLPDIFSMADLQQRVDEVYSRPFMAVLLQECERMNRLLSLMKKMLANLDLGLKGDLSMSNSMEELMNTLYNDKVPPIWMQAASGPSLRALGSWTADLLQRQRQLEGWTADLTTPKVTWLSGLFNPRVFLTAVMQVTARRDDLPLDKLTTVVEVTRVMSADEIEAVPRDGAYICGLSIEGARWDINRGQLDDAILKQLHAPMPVILVKAALKKTADSYACPVYKTLKRGRSRWNTGRDSLVFLVDLQTKQPPSKWVMAGVAAFLDVDS